MVFRDIHSIAFVSHFQKLSASSEIVAVGAIWRNKTRALDWNDPVDQLAGAQREKRVRFGHLTQLYSESVIDFQCSALS